MNICVSGVGSGASSPGWLTVWRCVATAFQDRPCGRRRYTREHSYPSDAACGGLFHPCRAYWLNSSSHSSHCNVCGFCDVCNYPSKLPWPGPCGHGQRCVLSRKQRQGSRASRIPSTLPVQPSIDCSERRERWRRWKHRHRMASASGLG